MNEPQEIVTIHVTRAEQQRLRRLNQLIRILRTQREGRGLIWIVCENDEVRLQIVDLHSIVAEVLRRFEP
ncbi:MAG: hypothetical protein H0X37_15275 [Herpetosiphonaceae bacterium]|nr:hypothetical protein [Herpetosiphonaceae bacterium]